MNQTYVDVNKWFQASFWILGHRHPQLVHHQQDHSVVKVQVEGHVKSEVPTSNRKQLKVSVNASATAFWNAFGNKRS